MDYLDDDVPSYNKPSRRRSSMFSYAPKVQAPIYIESINNDNNGVMDKETYSHLISDKENVNNYQKQIFISSATKNKISSNCPSPVLLIPSSNASPALTNKFVNDSDVSFDGFILKKKNYSLSNLSLHDIPSPNVNILSASPSSNKLKMELDNYKRDIDILRKTVAEKDLSLNQSKILLNNLLTKKNEYENKMQMSQEEIQSLHFYNSIQDQKVLECEEIISANRLEFNEELSKRLKKHKTIIKRLNEERSDYESRANLMITQMTEQMSQLQKMAMERIETLEKELMDERHINENLQNENMLLKLNYKDHKNDNSSNFKSPSNQNFKLTTSSPMLKKCISTSNLNKSMDSINSRDSNTSTIVDDDDDDSDEEEKNL